jgi:UrcA family protein
MSKLLLAAPVSAALVATLATSTYAQRSDEQSIAVQRSDLDLKTEAGRKTLERRITDAIHQMCPASNLSKSQKECIRAARAAISAQQPLNGSTRR